MRLASPLFFGSFTALSFALAAACSGGTFSEGDDTLDATVDGDRDAAPTTDASLTPDATTTTDATTPPDDAGGETDASAELDADVDVDAGPVQPGSACETVGQEFTQRCGTCGIQKAFCTAELVVGGYGSCVERHPAECASDAGTDAGSDAGTDAAADAGEEDAAVDAGPEDAGEPDAGEPDAGEPPVDTWVGYSIDVDFAVGASGDVAMTDVTLVTPRKLVRSRTCPTLFTGTLSQTDSALVRIRNPNAQSAKIELLVQRGGVIGGNVDAMLAVYGAPPVTDEEQLACFGRAINGGCPDPDGTRFQELACLQGGNAVTIPARGELYAYVAMMSGAWKQPKLNVKLISRP